MKHQHDLRTPIDNRSREAVQTSALMRDLDRILRIIDDEIAREEKDAGVFNRSNPSYPLLATTLRARRDNLANTITLLEKRLATLLERTDRIDDWRCPTGLLSGGALLSMTTSVKKDSRLEKMQRRTSTAPASVAPAAPAFVAPPSFRAMEHQGIEYRVVQTACPTGWKWTVQLPNSRISTGKTSSRPEAISRAQLAIEKALAVPSPNAPEHSGRNLEEALG
jgi:hypothetical protein